MTNSNKGQTETDEPNYKIGIDFARDELDRNDPSSIANQLMLACDLIHNAGGTGKDHSKLKDEILELARRYSHHQTEQAKLEARINEAGSIVNISGEGYFHIRKLDNGDIEYISVNVYIEELNAELERLKEQSLPTNNNKGEPNV